MGINDQLGVDASGNMVDQKQYRSMIGSLLYVTASRLDMMFSVCKCARYQASPRESHLKATKRILRYLKGTHDFGLWYPKGSNFELIGYSDSDYDGCKIDRMSTGDTCQLLGRSLVSWSSKKQNSVALSTAEAEYISVGSCCAYTWLCSPRPVGMARRTTIWPGPSTARPGGHRARAGPARRSGTCLGRHHGPWHGTGMACSTAWPGGGPANRSAKAFFLIWPAKPAHTRQSPPNP
jgi:hypothetical protein